MKKLFLSCSFVAACACKQFLKVNPVDKDILLDIKYNNCRIPNAIALTYDDGPNHKGSTATILATLRRHNIKATFFVIGKVLAETKEARDLLQQITKEGHLVGNHSWSHPHLDDMSPSRITDEVGRTDKEIKLLIGKTPRFIRPPYGECETKKTTDILCGIYKKKIARWNCDPRDWETKCTPRIILERVQEKLRGKCSRCHSWILLQHDTYQTTADTQDILIRMLKTQGYRFVTMDECIGEPGKGYMEDL